jgi:hypothetical protein
MARWDLRKSKLAGGIAGGIAGVLAAAWVLTSTEERSAHVPAVVAPAAAPDGELVQALARARTATAKYATDLPAAQADGYKVITPAMTDMGVHYLNPDVKGFDVERPAILVYVGKGDAVQLAALEWVFPSEPTTPPLPGATYGSFDAACHYADGEFIAGAEASCERYHPITNAPFFFWHPTLVTLHVWLWYPNPEGIFHGTNPMVGPLT